VSVLVFIKLFIFTTAVDLYFGSARYRGLKTDVQIVIYIRCCIICYRPDVYAGSVFLSVCGLQSKQPAVMESSSAATNGADTTADDKSVQSTASHACVIIIYVLLY